MNKAIKEMKPYMVREYGTDMGIAIISKAQSIWENLCKENNKDPKALKKHTENNMFPCISLYKAMEQCGIEKDQALEYLDKSWSERAQKGADQLATIFKIPGLYKLYPGIFEKVAKKSYGEQAGFKAKFYNMGKGRCKFDMIKCPFCETCEKYGCKELTKCFCHVDDVNNANLHPKLIWNRSKFMGGGEDYCDFDIYVKDRKGEDHESV